MKRIFAWLPAVLWMGMIFFLSSRAKVLVSEEESINFLIFKTLHVLEYAVLHILLFRAIHFEDRRNIFRSLFLSFVIAVVYAATDEIHQTVVPTRDGRPRDVIIDTTGVVLSWISIKQLFPILPKKLRALGKKWLLVS